MKTLVQKSAGDIQKSFETLMVLQVRAIVRRVLGMRAEFTPLFARLLLAGVMFPHGAQKVLGWWGGYGFTGSMNFFTLTMHIPAPLAFLAITAEFAGPVALVLGFGSRLAAFGIGTNMVVAALTSHVANGFFMNWYANQNGEGFEYHLLAGGVALIVVVRGGGRWALDSTIARKLLRAD